MRDKHQIIEEPCEAKVSCTVLKTSGIGDSLAEFNLTKNKSVSKGERFRSLVRTITLCGKREAIQECTRKK